jgi:CBS domain-containing protein
LARLDPGGETGLLPTLMRRASIVGAHKTVASDVMGSPALTVTAYTPLREAVRLMLEGRRKVLPIVDASGVLLGAADRSALLRQAHPPAVSP